MTYTNPPESHPPAWVAPHARERVARTLELLSLGRPGAIMVGVRDLAAAIVRVDGSHPPSPASVSWVLRSLGWTRHFCRYPYRGGRAMLWAAPGTPRRVGRPKKRRSEAR
jgi:hypothetical protein